MGMGISTTQLLEQRAIQFGRFKQCYALLAVLFFLYHLAQDPHFSVDFAHPISPEVADFLQSSRSLECLALGR